MSRFTNKNTGVVVSVDDSKDDRFSSGGWEPVGDKPAKKASAKTAAAKKKAG